MEICPLDVEKSGIFEYLSIRPGDAGKSAADFIETQLQLYSSS